MRISVSILRKAKSEHFAFLVIAISSFLTRIYSLSISPYPFNNDAITECTIASGILGSGHLDFTSNINQSTHSLGIPAFNVLIAYTSSLIGVTPLECAQFITATVAVVTIGGIYLLARIVTGSFLGGVTAGFMAVMFGTFVYTTGSSWKEALGAAFLITAAIAFLGRSQPRNRALLFVILMILPLTHHLVAAITLLTLALAICWSWFLALRAHSLRKRHIADLLMVAISVAWMTAYYLRISFDSSTLVNSRTALELAPVLFLVLSGIIIAVLSRKNHLRITFAPAVGLGVFVLLVLDYYGVLFPYTPSAPAISYFTLVCALVFILTIAWYGTELILESRPVHRTFQLCLLVAPLAIMGVAVLSGFSYSSQKVFYRTFDFLDVALFIGAAYALVALHHRRKLFVVSAVALIALSAVSFPFGYESERLLGVRHDTQPFEMDALLWLSAHNDSPNVVSDERIAYVFHALTDGWKNPYLPAYIMRNASLPPSFYVVEDSWTTVGVNDYPRGKVVIPLANYTSTLGLANVFYVGGPASDKIQVFIAVGVSGYQDFPPPQAVFSQGVSG